MVSLKVIYDNIKDLRDIYTGYVQFEPYHAEGYVIRIPLKKFSHHREALIIKAKNTNKIDVEVPGAVVGPKTIKTDLVVVVCGRDGRGCVVYTHDLYSGVMHRVTGLGVGRLAASLEDGYIVLKGEHRDMVRIYLSPEYVWF